MVCSVSCMISAVFIIGMIYFYNAASKSVVVQQYRNQLSMPLREIYDKIAQERAQISMKGFIIGFILSLFIIFYNYKMKRKNIKINYKYNKRIIMMKLKDLNKTKITDEITITR